MYICLKCTQFLKINACNSVSAVLGSDSACSACILGNELLPTRLCSSGSDTIQSLFN